MGRPRSFAREDVLDRAIEVFWRRGYEGTSIRDLVGSMGIERGSLYGAFGDKHQLFLAALDRYEQRFHRKLLSELERPGSARRAIEGVFDRVVRECLCRPGRKGCLLTNAAVELAGTDGETRVRIRDNFERLERAFERAVRRARREGEIAAKHSPKALARFLTSSLQGLRVMTKACSEEKILRDIVRVTLSALGSPQRARRRGVAGAPRRLSEERSRH